MIESIWQDIRVGFRVLFKEKAFCFLAVLVLGLGVCGVTTQFTVINALVLRPFSFPHPEQLASVGLIDPQGTPQNNNFGAGNIPSVWDYEDLKAAQQSFSQMAGYLNGSTINVSYKSNPQRYTGGYVTEDFFKITGVSPILGRDFTAEDNKPGAEKVTILGHEIWQRDFAGDPRIVGESVRINGKAATIIGVMPPNFKFPVSEQLWVPLYNEFPPKQRGDPSANGCAILGRLKPGVSFDRANVEFAGLAQRLAKEHPKTNGQLTSASVQPLQYNFTGPQLRQTVYAMMAAVILVLIIACVNVMNMQFGRAALRARELAIRGALGATRWRIVRQMLTESFLVAILGGIVGVVMAFWAISLLISATKGLPFPLPYWVNFAIDPTVLTFTLISVGAATLLSGLVPALVSARANAAEMMKEGGRGNSGRLVSVITRILVVGQIALTAALLIAAVLQIKSIRNQIKLDYGYDENGVYSARMGLMEGDYPNDEARQQFFARALRMLRANPSFAGAALTGRFRMTFGGFGQYEV
ncbi:MAG TPA: ABC transporter permease, partial [Chthoniobacterales bacterium]|nr:ABC transporter permease [Chthoniobacterales bacterium]